MPVTNGQIRVNGYRKDLCLARVVVAHITGIRFDLGVKQQLIQSVLV